MRFFIEHQQPQKEITVLLRGFGPPRDVTRCHGPASTIPCTLWVAFDRGQGPKQSQREWLTLEFCESESLIALGEIGLKWRQTVEAGPVEILVFEPRSAVSRCHQRLHGYAHRLLLLWKQHHNKSKIKLTPLEHVAMSVLFTCPRPISLVSVEHGDRANLFPLNVMGDVPDGYFAFALTACKLPAQLLESARCFALSTTPIEQAPIAFALAINHNRDSIKWKDLPFPTRPSSKLSIPVPTFSPRVRDMIIESVHRVGSHSLFVARTISDEGVSTGPEFSVVHGFYQAWRIRNGLDSSSSIAHDALIRGGTLSNGDPA